MCDVEMGENMDVRNCKNCGTLFNYIGGAPICAACKKKLEDKFYEVRCYLDENPNATISQVSEEVDVSVKQIKQWIKEERLTLTEATVDGICCESCGTPIRSGRFCDKCKLHIQNELTSALNESKAKVETVKKKDRDGNRMRFLQ